MTKQKVFLSRLLLIYSRVYQWLAWATLLFLVIGGIGCAWEATKGHWDAVFSYLSSGGALVILDVRFFIWWKICWRSKSALETNSRGESLRKISKLFLWSFGLDVLKLAYQNIIPLERTDWDSVSFPQYSESRILFLRDSMSYFFKITVVWDNFLTPTTIGLSSVFLSLLFKYLAESGADTRNQVP